MSFNVPDYDAEKLSFGPGVIYMGAVGETPSTDIGAVDEGMALAHSAELLDVLQGNPRRLIKSFRTSETVTLAFAGFEWKIENLEEYLGAGHHSGDDFAFGGDINVTEVSLRLVHQMPPSAGAAVGGTVTLDIWRARSNGDLTLTFGADLHSFPVTFTTLQATEDWAGNSLGQGYEYYNMNVEYAP